MKTKLFTILFFTACIIPNFLFAQFSQHGPKLTGTGGAGSSQLGEAVALSADGNTAILGGPTDGSTGAAWIFIRVNGVWTQQGPKLVGSGNIGSSLQGASVSLSADGNTAAIGGYGDNNAIGATWIFTRSGSTWTQQGQKLIGTGYTGQCRQGSSVSLSGDGNTLIIGGPTDSSGRGGAWVFSRTAGVWSQQTQRLMGSGAVGPPSFGTSVSMSQDGNTSVIGGASDINGIYQVGAAWIFVRSGNLWIQQGPKLAGTGNVGHSFQGRSVSISSDGNTVISGGHYDNDFMGAAWIFVRSNGAWYQQGPKLVGAGSVGGNIWQGFSVSISGDGNTAVVGGWGDNTMGASWIFVRTDSAWYQLGDKLVGSGAVGNSEQGLAVAISNNGTTVIEGGDLDNNNAGAVWVFDRSAFRLVVPHHNLHKLITGNQITYDTTTIATNIISYFITNINVTMDSIHYVNLSDLEVTITHQYGLDFSSSLTDTLIYQVGGTGTNFIETVLSDSASTPIANGTAPFTGTFKPSKPLSSFHNIDPSGKWILNVYDRITGHSGTLDAWTLTVDMAPNPIGINNISHNVPNGFKLMQNYPNPFNPSTKIKFQIAAPPQPLPVGEGRSLGSIQPVSLIVYDILGRVAAELVDQQLQPGTYEVDFNGSKLSSGVYFYKLVAGDFSETKKLVLIK